MALYDITNAEYMIEGCIKILNLYKPLIDSYMIEYFTEEHAKTLLPSWRMYLNKVDFQTLGYILDYQHLGSIYCNEHRNTTVIIPPLSLLAVRKCLNMYCLPRVMVPDIDKTLEECEISTDNLEQTGSAGQCDMLEPKLWLKVKAKKRHEIERVIQLIHRLRGSMGHIVDVGAGLGHLSRIVAYQNDISVTCLEADEGMTIRAEVIDENVSRILKAGKTRKQTHIAKTIDFHEASSSGCLFSDFKTDDKVCLMGLHCCGDLSVALLKQGILNKSCNCCTAIIVGCCYMKLNRGLDRIGYDHYQPMGNYAKSTSHDLTYGYPLSGFLKKMTSLDTNISYNAREMACHNIEQYMVDLQDPFCVQRLKIHCYRAVLEKIIVSKYQNCCRMGLRGVKRGHELSFYEYCCKALENHAAMKECVDDYDREDIDNLLCQWPDVAKYYAVRVLLAPLIETIILIDRLLFVLESGDYNACLLPLFDPSISARNIALIVKKK